MTTARATLIDEVFGGSLPSETGSLSSTTSPVAGLSNLASTQEMSFTGYTAKPIIWTPTSPNGNLILAYQGHEWSYNSGNFPALLQQLLTAGYTVVGFVMPGGANTLVSGSATNHDANHQALSEFVGPVIAAINTLEGSFSNIYMTGLSGGGWATTLAAALDIRIAKSYPVAGSLPVYMDLTETGSRDWEQTLPGLSASYLDLYLLGATPSRRQKQILHNNDPCCFSLTDYQTGQPYENFIEDLATDLGGDYDLVFKNKNVHEWDTTIFNDEVLSELP